MAWILLFAFIAVPIVEIAVFIEVGGVIGLWPTLGLVILTAAIGTWQLRLQGLATLERARSQLDRGVMPARELFDGLCLLLAGGLLLTPGFVTDFFGLLLFLPPVRRLLRDVVGRRMAASGEVRVWVNGEEVTRGRRGSGVIDGEYSDVTPEDEPGGDRLIGRDSEHPMGNEGRRP